MPVSPKTQMLVDLSCIDKSIGGKVTARRSLSKDSSSSQKITKGLSENKTVALVDGKIIEHEEFLNNRHKYPTNRLEQMANLTHDPIAHC